MAGLAADDAGVSVSGFGFRHSFVIGYFVIDNNSSVCDSTLRYRTTCLVRLGLPTMYRFQITIHACGASVSEGSDCAVGGCKVRTLDVPHEALAQPMNVSFEEAAESLRLLPRMYVEPDGCLVWVSSSDDDLRWQVDGNLYDRGGRLMFVDLSGTCPPGSFDDLLRCFGWPDTAMMFQLTRQALFLGESEFRRFAERSNREEELGNEPTGKRGQQQKKNDT
jgi:hypothetical protein